MEKVGSLVRSYIKAEIEKRLTSSDAVFFFSFNKVGAGELAFLRNNLRKANASIFVSKNSLIKRAFKEAGYPEVEDFLERETAIVFTGSDDSVSVCKELVAFSKENENFLIRGGFLSPEKKLFDKDIISLSKLPLKNTLLAMATAAIASPLRGFVNIGNQMIVKFLLTLKEIAKKKENS